MVSVIGHGISNADTTQGFADVSSLKGMKRCPIQICQIAARHSLVHGDSVVPY